MNTAVFVPSIGFLGILTRHGFSADLVDYAPMFLAALAGVIIAVLHIRFSRPQQPAIRILDKPPPPA